MKRLSLLLILLWSCLSLAQEGGIPSRYLNDPAVDLTRNGKLLHPDEVHDLVESTRGKFDISLLDPVETSDLWKNVIPKELPEDKTPIQEMDTVTYHSPVLSPSGIFRFNIVNDGRDGKFYTMMLSKTVHTALLAKSLLRKLGYQVPDIKHLPKVIVKFKNELEKKSFLSYLENVAYAGSAKSWVAEDLGDRLILQDLVVMDSNHIIYNLAFGVTPDMVQGRRLLSSLAVPFAVVNLTESVNLLRWHAGHVTNKRIILFVDKLEDFQCTWDDARWIARRLARLSREDWKEIVASSQTPIPVQQLLLEKILSRRNSVLSLFKIDHEPLPVNSEVSNGLELVKGKLTQEKWPGYASRFAYGDPDSPVSDSDMKSWIKSRAISTAMEIALGQINQLPFLGTDIDAINSEKYKQYMEQAVSEAVQAQRPVEVPVKAWVFPTFRGNLILSRNLVTGTFLGTDNLVQLVDTVGVTLSGGLAAGTMGIQMPNIAGGSMLPVGVAGGAQATLLRTYAHLRPVLNIKKSLKYPFKNIFVPLVKMDYGKLLHEATKVAVDPNSTEDEREAKIQAALRPLKDAMNIGESILVTDSFVTGAAAGASANLYGRLLMVGLGLSSNHMVVSRFHVHRRNEHDFHIYRDLGHKGSVGVQFGLHSLIPILTLSTKSGGGHAKVTYYNVNLDPKNPKVLENASALRRAIVHSSTREMEEKEILPYVLKHRFKEQTPQMNLLFWQFIKQNSSTHITVKNPEGEERYFNRHYYGMTQGRNYQAYLNALINHWVNLLWDKDAGLSDATGTNPGYSFKGRAKTHYLTLDQELDKNGNVLEPFISLNRSWNGWSIDQKKAQELLEEIRHRYKFEFYSGPVLANSHKIYLYNIGVTMLFYQKGIEHLLNLDENRIKRIFLEHEAQDNLVINPQIPEEKENEDFDADIYEETGVNRFLRLLKRYKKNLAKGREDRANKFLLKALSYMDKKIYLPGIVKLVGGDENIYVTSRITGFREGDEDGDRPVISNSLGEYGSPRILGPLVQFQRTTDMLEGELFINWLMQRLI